MTSLFGFLNIDKPLGLTSHDVVAKVRRRAAELGHKGLKVGHAGTLDPLATGVLVVCLGAATRLSEYAMDTTKRYRARVHLGVNTETYDAEGAVTAERDASHITRDDVIRLLPEFTGKIEQFPPMYSAIKQGGRKLYELARAGQEVERVARAVRIDALEVSEWQPPLFTLDVTCSAGTYIRSLAHDLGERLGVGAHLAGLIRTGSGAFRLANALPLDTLLAADNWAPHLIMPNAALPHMPMVTVDESALDALVHGRTVEGGQEGVVALAYHKDEQLIAIVRGVAGAWKPEKVFIGADLG
jgi:tRNA pseudouridine55 synthase